jgi:mannose-1-phosphate guanylyltransferase / phosphomannomutase
MVLVIIAGGKGTRLGLTDIPKPMVAVNGKPLLEHQLLLAKRYGIKRVFILAGHLSNKIFDYFKDGNEFGLKITYIIEPYPLGTAGSVKLLEHILHERFLLFYGDVALDIDIDGLAKFDACHHSLASIAVHPNDHPIDSDLVEINNENKVIAFHSKPHIKDIYLRNLVNAGVYLFSPEIFTFIPFGKLVDFGKDIFPQLLLHNKGLYAYTTTEYIKDLGTPERLKQVESDMAIGKISRLNRSNKRKAIFLDRDGVINVFIDNLSNADAFELLPGVASAIRRINKSEYLTVVVTNQPMIAKGFLSEKELYRIHCKMESLLGAEHAFLDAIYYCPHHPEKGFAGEIPELKVICNCRKPSPGMLLNAARDLNIDLANSWMVGDSSIDIIAGNNAGCNSILLKGRYQETESCPYIQSKDLNDALDLISRKEKI